MSAFPTTLNPLPGTSAYASTPGEITWQDPRAESVQKYDEAGNRSQLLSTLSLQSDAAILSSINTSFYNAPAEPDYFTIQPFGQPSGDYSAILGVASFYSSLVQSGLTGLFGNVYDGPIGIEGLQALLGASNGTGAPSVGSYIDSFG